MSKIQGILTKIAYFFAFSSVVFFSLFLYSTAPVEASTEDYGTGIDGNLVVSSTVNVNTTRASVSGTSGSNILNLSNSTGSFSNGQLVLVHQSRGTNAGVWEFARISVVATSQLTLDENLENSYLTDAGGSRAQVVNVPEYVDLTVASTGVVRPSGWDGNTGGIVAFFASGTVNVDGIVLANGGGGGYTSTQGAGGGSGGGFRGGGVGFTQHGVQGEGVQGLGSLGPFANSNGGGGGDRGYGDSGGGGGGNGSPGANGKRANDPRDASFGGSVAGSVDLIDMVFGGGGGGATQDNQPDGAGGGGSGGGIVWISAKEINVSSTGSIKVNGGNGGSPGNYDSGGGAGAGGSLYIRGNEVTLGSGIVTATAGAAFKLGGSGGSGRIRVEYCDAFSGTTQPVASTFQLACNQPPEVTANGSYSVNEGGVVQLSATGTDPDVGDTLNYIWDLDNNGIFETPGQTVTFDASNLDGPSSYPVAVQVTDSGGLTSIDFTTVNVSNVAPTATLVAPASVNQYSTFSLSLANPVDISEADTNSGFEYSFDCGDGNFSSFSINDNIDCVALVNGNITVMARIRDKDLGASPNYIEVVDVIAQNTPPGSEIEVILNNVDVTFDNVTKAGDTILTTSTQGPPPPNGFRLGTPATYYELSTTAVFDQAEVCFNYSGTSLDTNNPKEDNLKLFHHDNNTWVDATTSLDTNLNIICAQVTSFSPFAVFSTNENPEITQISAPVDPNVAGVSINTTATFSDADVNDTHTAIWDWGDGTNSQGQVNESGGSGTTDGSHTYLNPGVYTLTLTVADNDTGVAEQTFEFVVIYNPDGGFVTGGGWISSPIGAYIAEPSLTGKANFGFNSKYKNGADIPTGETQFQFKAADFNFHSTDYDWLVVAGAQAKFKGTGTINGVGNYGFQLSATDGSVNGGGGIDKFRIKIWDKDNGDTVVYDNMLGASDNDNPATELQGGNIVIHNN